MEGGLLINKINKNAMIENKNLTHIVNYAESVKPIQRMSRAVHSQLYFTDYETTALDDAINNLCEIAGIDPFDATTSKCELSVRYYAMQLRTAINNGNKLVLQMIRNGEDHFFVQRVVDAAWHQFKMVIAAPRQATYEKYLTMLQTVGLNGNLLKDIHHNRYDIDRFAKAMQKLAYIKATIKELENAGVTPEKYGMIDFTDSYNGVSISAFEAYCEILDAVQDTLSVYCEDRTHLWCALS
jgi:hypothetical protein